MKKAQSSVISTVLLILVVVVIGGIIVVFSTGFIKKQTEKQELSDISKKLGIKITAIYSIYSNTGTGSYYGYITLTRTDNEEIPLCNAAFIFYLNNGNTVDYDTNALLPESGMNKEYSINYTKIRISSKSQIEKAEIRAKCPKGATSSLDEESEII